MTEIGILDHLGKHKNPLTNEDFSETYKLLAETWSKLPAYKDRIQIINDIKKNQVLLIESSTGSGKTVLVPKYALHSTDYQGKIAVTLPKRDITLSSAAYSALTLDVELGAQVGYQVKGNNKQSSETKLLYATDGTIVARLMSDPSLKDFDIVIIDEAHERKVQIDLLLYLLRETLKLRSDFKLIIMSATINIDLFHEYYKDFKFKSMKLAGETHFAIDSFYLDNPAGYTNRINSGFDILMNILASIDKLSDEDMAGFNDIIFFITSQNEAFSLCRRLNDVISKEIKDKTCKISCKNKILCLELFSGVNDEKKKLALTKDYKHQGYTVKVIFATNVAESSLTIDTIKYVIDNGHELNDSYDPKIRAFKLDKKLISHAQAKQRMGRAGRTSPGTCYHLYTKDEFDGVMERFPKPAIKTSNIFPECLRLLNLKGIDTIDRLTWIINQFIEPPEKSYLDDAKDLMIEKNLITNNTMNYLGQSVTKLVDEPLDGIALITAKILNCSHEVLKIISAYSYIKDNIGGIFRTPNAQHQKTLFETFKKNKLKLAHKYGDYLTLLKIFEKYTEYSQDQIKLDKWIAEFFLKKDTIRNIVREHKKMSYNTQTKLKELDLEKLKEPLGLSQEVIDSLLKLNVDDRIMFCFAKGHDIATRHNFNDTYTTEPVKKAGMRLNIMIDKNSFLVSKYQNKDLPTKVIYKKLFIAEGSANLNIVSKLPKSIKSLLI